jgi:ubiquinol-cytochrome c reductase cytochrome c1 subunit
MRKLLAVLLALPVLAWASSAKAPLERAPLNLHDKISLQRGAQVFVNHCLGCHSAGAMRYARLSDLGLDEAQIRDNLLFTGEKVGETMTIAMEPAIAKASFGVVPPDLSLAARSRSADWLYTYLRSFYRDPATKTGWNNAIFPNVAMPHALWEYQGDQVLQVTEKMDDHTGDIRQTRKLVVERPGTLTPVQYDQMVGDLVNYLAYMAEPTQNDRRQWGVVVLFVLAVFLILALLLKTEYWKDVR